MSCRCNQPRSPQGPLWDTPATNDTAFSKLKVTAEEVKEALGKMTPEELAEYKRKIEERCRPYRTVMRFR
jgi:transcription initiation factor IIE alpha subunit